MSAAAPEVFVVDLPVFTGSLADLAAALRAGQLLPAEVPLLDLTRAVLTWAQGWRDAHARSSGGADLELLPPLATVIALKARLLLPQPEAEALPDGDPDDFDDVLEGVEALAELGELVRFLSERRREREGLIAARPIELHLPRRERPRKPGSAALGLDRLVRAARNAVRDVQVPLLAIERLSLAGALKALRAFAGRLGFFAFDAVPAQDWGERTTYFAALLEGVKAGDFSATQDEAYGVIQVEAGAGVGRSPAAEHLAATGD